MDPSDRPQDQARELPLTGSTTPAPPSSQRYLFPRQPHEVDRLDLQHYALREAVGANYLGPVQRPRAILDAGAGTGRWGLDLRREFPEALVVGLDLDTAPAAPNAAGLSLVRGDASARLPFAEASFDFVHQRLLRAGIPLRRWPDAVAELVRVTRPGGSVELVEIRNGVRPAGPATQRLFSLLLRISEALGLDVEGPPRLALDWFLEAAGAETIESRDVDLPVGEWGGRVGSFMASNTRAMFTGLSPAFEARFQVPAAETVRLVRAMLDEIERLHSRCTVAYVWGRRPSREATQGAAARPGR